MKMTFFNFAFQSLFVRKKQELNFCSHINPLCCSFSEPYYSCVCCPGVVFYSFKMAALADILSVEAVRELVQNHTLKEVSNILQTEFPNQRGLSVKSIQRFCQAQGQGIAKRNTVTDDELDQIVESSVRQVNLIILWPSFVF